jgi:hypothetical protein
MSSLFVSYRRGDSEGQARALVTELKNLLGSKSVFIDVDSIEIGRDFRKAPDRALDSCDVMLVLIGKDWLDAKDASGNRRLDDPTDYVRLEIAGGLKREVGRRGRLGLRRFASEAGSVNSGQHSGVELETKRPEG